MTPSQPIRALVAAGTVGLYMAIGWLFRLDPNSYLLVGIPLLLVFQLFVARGSLVELWLKHPPCAFFTWQGLLATALFAIYPIYTLVADWKVAEWPVRLWEIAAVAGTLPLGATLVHARAKTWTSLLICFLTGGLLGGGLMLLVSLANHHGWHPHHHVWQILTSNFLLYLPICFVVEEVFFRGGIDSYLQQPGDKHGWLTAIFVSVLWGWWHMPIFPIKTVLEIIALFVSLPMITCLSGIAFSFCWRRSGTLLVTATVHALIDSFRNAIM